MEDTNNTVKVEETMSPGFESIVGLRQGDALG